MKELDSEEQQLPKWARILKAASIAAQQDAEREFLETPVPKAVRATSATPTSDRPRQRYPVDSHPEGDSQSGGDA